MADHITIKVHVGPTGLMATKPSVDIEVSAPTACRESASKLATEVATAVIAAQQGRTDG